MQERESLPLGSTRVHQGRGKPRLPLRRPKAVPARVTGNTNGPHSRAGGNPRADTTYHDGGGAHAA